MSISLSKPILYLITRGATTELTSRHSPEFRELLVQIGAASDCGIDLIQIREKRLTGRVLFDLTSAAVERCQHGTTRILVNDRADIAVAAGASGVHLTTNSLGAATIRNSFGDDFLIGVSTHSRAEARAARDQGADFVVFGPIFNTESKAAYGAPVGLEQLSETTEELAQFPVLALGGIDVDNAHRCLAAGAWGIAGIGLFSDPNRIAGVSWAIKQAANGDEK